jgi:hypothetical protein
VVVTSVALRRVIDQIESGASQIMAGSHNRTYNRQNR